MKQIRKLSPVLFSLVLVFVLMVVGVMTPAVAQDAGYQYNLDGILATGPIDGTPFEQNGFSVVPGSESTILVTGNVFPKNTPLQAMSPIVDIGGNPTNGMYAIGRRTLQTFSTANGGLVPTNTNIAGGNILDSHLSVYAVVGEGCLVMFDDRLSSPVWKKVAAGGSTGFVVQDADDCGDMPQFAKIAHLQWLAALNNITVVELSNPVNVPATVSAEQPTVPACQTVTESEMPVELTEQVTFCFQHNGEAFLAGFFNGGFAIKGQGADGNPDGRSWVIGTRDDGTNAMGGAPAQLVVVGGVTYLMALPAQ